jgi:hypothetical protein
VRAFKERHYSEWPDQPVPALSGRTPREAARSRSGRSALDLLLKQMENQEARGPREQAYDFTKLRRELAID